jgi:RNase P/RNase MRP subunit p29
MRTNQKRTATAIFLLINFTIGLHAEVREFTNTSGRGLRGELVQVSGESVTIRREDGQVFTLKAASFSAVDQAYFKQQAEKLTEKKEPAPKITPKNVRDLPFCSTMKAVKLDPRAKGMFDELKVTTSERIRIHGKKKNDTSRIGDQVGYHLGKVALFPPDVRTGTISTKYATEKSSRRQFIILEYADKLDYQEFEQPATQPFQWSVTSAGDVLTITVKNGATEVISLKGDLTKIQGVGFGVTLRWIDTEADTVINFDP